MGVQLKGKRGVGGERMGVEVRQALCDVSRRDPSAQILNRAPEERRLLVQLPRVPLLLRSKYHRRELPILAVRAAVAAAHHVGRPRQQTSHWSSSASVLPPSPSPSWVSPQKTFRRVNRVPVGFIRTRFGPPRRPGKWAHETLERAGRPGPPSDRREDGFEGSLVWASQLLGPAYKSWRLDTILGQTSLSAGGLGNVA